jgi:hypothetical protein
MESRLKEREAQVASGTRHTGGDTGQSRLAERMLDLKALRAAICALESVFEERLIGTALKYPLGFW